MRFLHLSDLHLGKRVGEVSMLEDQRYILTGILQIIDSTSPRAVLISGDVYDKSVPPAEAVTLLDEFFYQLSRRDLQVYVIAGNHDSPERLSFGNRLMEHAGIVLSPVYDGEARCRTLYDEYGPVNFYLLPFIKPIHVRRFFPEEEIITYTDAVNAAIKHMNINPAERNVLLAHQFVTGSRTCDSEEISVGGSDNVDACVFEDFDYVALGHLHGPQSAGARQIRYCGTPLKYSFSEISQYKSITQVDLGPKGDLHMEAIPLQPRLDMRELRGPFARLTDPEFYRAQNREDYLHIILTDEEDVPEAVGRLDQIYPNMLQLSYDNRRTRENQQIGGAQDVESRSPLELFGELYEKQNNQPMTEVQSRFVRDLMEKIWEEEA